MLFWVCRLPPCMFVVVFNPCLRLLYLLTHQCLCLLFSHQCLCLLFQAYFDGGWRVFWQGTTLVEEGLKEWDPVQDPNVQVHCPLFPVLLSISCGDPSQHLHPVAVLPFSFSILSRPCTSPSRPLPVPPTPPLPSLACSVSSHCNSTLS